MSAEIAVLIPEAEAKALRRLVQLTDAENPRIALRACEVVVRYAREWRRAAEPSAPAPKVKVPEALVHPPKPKPAFRAVPLDKFAALADLSAPRPVPTG